MDECLIVQDSKVGTRRKITSHRSYHKAGAGKSGRERNSLDRAQTDSRESEKVAQGRLSFPNGFPRERKGNARASFAPNRVPERAKR